MPANRSSARRAVINPAQKDAWEQRQTQVDTGHLPLAILDASDDQVAAELAAQGVTAEQVRNAIEEAWDAGTTDGKPWRFPTPDGLPPITLNASLVIDQVIQTSETGFAINPAALLVALTNSRCLAGTVLYRLRTLSTTPDNIARCPCQDT
ncbi:Clp protease N-terminal domain-containing protein [Kitasatospora sp. CB02891]|uniref:Clp protease N-terminal domain-containing protein n=1 Tax=Kitasatospora sp. CB02891 TaxID=2020329 RepID=UPI0012FDC4AE|nr:Clp protease N-terminal domain-containing protein [Kitasatospora sp. CB02891]